MTNISKFELQALNAYLFKTNPNYRNANIDKPVSSGIVFEFGKRYDVLSLYQRDISVYRQGGWYDLSLRTQKALDSILDFFEKRK